MDPATVTTVISEILKYGAPGLVIVVLMIVIWNLWAEVKTHISARLEDQLTFQTKLTELVTNSINATKDLSTMIQLLKEKIK